MNKKNYLTPSVDLFRIHIPERAIMAVSNQADASGLQIEVDYTEWPSFF